MVALAARHRIPAMYIRLDAAEAGGLMAYGASQTYTWRQVGTHVGRILKGEKVHVIPVSTERDYDDAFAFVRDRRPAALLISPDGFLQSRPQERAAILLRDKVPAIAWNSDFAVAGGLMSYSANDMSRAAGVYVGRILKGEKPGDLPVQEATAYALTINLKTAAALGITFPTGLLARADEVIE
jgi:putative tryptophan/tyrosine transport system substrate-binding protein